MKRLIRLSVVVPLFGVMVVAQAALRFIPADAAVTTLRMQSDGSVELGGKPFRLNLAAQIRDADNRIVLPSMLNGSYKVRVLMDGSGQLLRAWILTGEEAAQPAPKF